MVRNKHFYVRVYCTVRFGTVVHWRNQLFVVRFFCTQHNIFKRHLYTVYLSFGWFFAIFAIQLQQLKIEDNFLRLCTFLWLRLLENRCLVGLPLSLGMRNWSEEVCMKDAGYFTLCNMLQYQLTLKIFLHKSENLLSQVVCFCKGCC